jgi:hypothetical protein
MSRSIPTENNPNPCTRWFEWNAGEGNIRYYDKTSKKNVEIEGTKFGFLLLDELATIKGWNNDSESGIYSNEVRDTRAETLLVKAFKRKVPIAEGFYKQIKDRVVAEGGHFVANCYIAFRSGNKMELGSIQFKGAALAAWMEFTKANKTDLYKKAIFITPGKSVTKGTGKKAITFIPPVFKMTDTTPESDEAAKTLDGVLQSYLKAYFKRTRNEQTRPEDEDQSTPDEPGYVHPADRGEEPEPEPEEDDIPF